MSIKKEDTSSGPCPICQEIFNFADIDEHVNKCIFLNSIEVDARPSKRKRSPLRSPSPVLISVKETLKQVKHEVSPSTSRANLFASPDTQKYAPGYLSYLFFYIPTLIIIEVNGHQTKLDKQLTFTVPLAQQVQPKTLNDFIGQEHVLGENSVLRSLFEKGDVPNMILWGPPGCGKTSLSGVIQSICKDKSNKLRYTSLCAATAGVKDVQNIISTAQFQLKCGCRTVLFMDEIHRFNKKQQDVFLLHVEKGDIILVGATTENPSFTVNSALLSRCRVIVLNKLGGHNLDLILRNAAKSFSVTVTKDEQKVLSKGYVIYSYIR